MRIFLAGNVPEAVLSHLDRHPGVRATSPMTDTDDTRVAHSWDCCLVGAPEDADGLDDLLEALHRQLPRVPLGFVAGHEHRDHALKALRFRGIDRIIPSDIDAAGLDSALKALAEHNVRLTRLQAALSEWATPTIFLTGATGFLGGHFLRYLLRCTSTHVIALTRQRGNTPFDQRLTHLDRLHPGRIVCVEGDVGLPGLGLSDEAHALVAAQPIEVWHMAAITRFEEMLREAIFNVNLEGTRHVVNFSRKLPDLKHLHHVSTAYVAGNGYTAAPVPEAPLERPATFKNPYEESKYEAEQCVVHSDLPWTIYRPSIILGESVSGLCDGQTVYNVAKMLRLAQKAGARQVVAQPETPRFRVVVDQGAAKNLIHVDDVVCRMLHIAAHLPERGSCFHITHDVPTPMTDLIAVIAALLDIPEYESVQTLDGAPLSAAEALLERISGVFRPYMLSRDAHFESDHAYVTSGRLPLCPMNRRRLHFLMQSFLEQHYPCEAPSQPVLACS